MKKLNVSKEEFCKIVSDSYSYRNVLTAISWPVNGKYLKKLKTIVIGLRLDVSHFGKRPSLNDSAVTPSLAQLPAHAIVKNLIASGELDYDCTMCGRDKWDGEPIPLKVGYANGNLHDTTKENLCLVCLNCDYICRKAIPGYQMRRHNTFVRPSRD